MEQIENVTLGPRYTLRLDDLSRWHRLQAVCLACRHARVIDPQSLRGRWPGYTRIIELEKNLRCAACGNKEGNALKVGKLPRG